MRPVCGVSLALALRAGIHGQQPQRKTLCEITIGSLGPGAAPRERRRPNGAANKHVTEKLIRKPVCLGCIPPKIEQVVIHAANARHDPGMFLPIRGLQPPRNSEGGEQVRSKNRATIAIIAEVKSSRLTAPRQHLLERSVIFFRAVNTVVIIVVDEKVRHVVDHHDLLQRLCRHCTNRRRH